MTDVIPGAEPGPKAEGLSADTLPEAKLDEAIAFLQRVRPEGPWALTAIFPDPPEDRPPTHTETFFPGEEDRALAWLEKLSGRMNLYWTVNPTIGRIRSKARKEDVEAITMLHVDIDPDGSEDPAAARAAARAKLATFSPPPSFEIDSGGGMQGFWLLDEALPVDGDEEQGKVWEAYSKQLEIVLGGDSCHDCCRVMRLPGTINLPNTKKRKKGRKPRLASLVEYHEERVYPLHDFWPAQQQDTGPASPSRRTSNEPRPEPVRLENTAELDRWNVGDDVKTAIAHGCDPDDKTHWNDDRSALVFYVCCELYRCGVPPELIVGIISDERWDISAHVIEKGKRNVPDYAWRQFDRAKDDVDAKAEAFATTEDGKVYANHQGNIRLALRKLGVALRHDTFADRSVIEGLDGHGPHLDDAARDRLWLEIDERFRFRPHLEFFTRVLMDTARNAPFHPVCDYLDGLQWDGVPRLDRWLSTYGGAADTEYTRAVGALPLVAAVRRVRQPGCKFDEMLILESEQGTNKSSALRLMAVRDEQFGDDVPLNADGKKVIEQTAGKWWIEAGELKGMRKGEVEHLKAFLSRQDDTARLSYARLPVIVPRQFVVIGTTNSERYLRDLTGNRRFWPVRVGCFDLEALRRDRDQIWAEAAAREAAGASIRLDPSLYAAAGVEQDARKVEDPHVETLAAALGDRTGKLRAADVWNLLGMPPSQRTQDQNARVGDAMRELGWKRTKLRFGGRPEWAYAKGSKRQLERSLTVSVNAAGYFVDDAGSSESDGGDDDLPY